MWAVVERSHRLDIIDSVVMMENPEGVRSAQCKEPDEVVSSVDHETPETDLVFTFRAALVIGSRSGCTFLDSLAFQST